MTCLPPLPLAAMPDLPTLAVLWLVGTAISYVTLLVVIPIARSIAQFSFPAWSEALWKLAIVAGVVNLVSVLLDPFAGGLIAAVLSAVVFFFLMWKWFDIDFFGGVVIVLVSWVLRWIIALFVFAMLMSAMR